MAPGEAAEELALFFNNISQEYEPLQMEQIPTTFAREIEPLSNGEVAKMLSECKKSKAKVPGDINSELYSIYHGQLSTPITDIFNTIIIRTKKWLSLWKQEYVTVILKGNGLPENPGECRNISCTNFLSKLFERTVLKWARQEVTPKLNQYGGEPGASATHLLISVLDYIFEALEDNRTSVVLSAIGFSKAFNSLEHSACLNTFAKRGASTKVLQLLAAFLMGRSMTVRVGTTWSQSKAVNAGHRKEVSLDVIYLT